MEIAVLACQVYEIQITTYLLVRIPHFMFVARPILIPIQAVPYEIPAFVTIDVPRVARHVIVDFTRSVDLTPLTARQGIEKVARSVFRHTHAAAGILDIEERMGDVKKRYGSYPQAKWNSNIALMHYFEDKTKKNIYDVCDKDSFVPGDI